MMGQFLSYRGMRRAGGQVLREAGLYPRLMVPPTGSPRVAFLPGEGRVWSSLLRAYNVADALEQSGWSTLVVPPQLGLSQRRRILRMFGPDVVVVQQCRHPLNRIEYLREWRLVLDIDDADFLSPELDAALSDVARHADGVICGSRYVRDWAKAHNPNSTVIWTGGPVTERPSPAQRDRGPIVTWAQSRPLQYQSEFAFAERVMLDVARHRPDVRYRLYGWDMATDHPALDRLRAAGVTVELRPFLAYDNFLLSLQDCAVGLCPYIPEGFVLGKSFGKIIGYLDARVPVVCSDVGDHSQFFSTGTGIVSNDPAVWVDAVVRLLDDPDWRQAVADGAHAQYLGQLSLGAMAARVDGFLRPIAARTPAARTGSPKPAATP